MPKTISILLSALFLASCCHAEARWCAIIGKDPADELAYPPIARDARVSGVVLSRIYYFPTGQVEHVEAISGPAMLSRALSEQMNGWKIKTDPQGNDLCTTLVIAEFRLKLSDEVIKERPKNQATPSILYLSTDSEPPIISDPASVIYWSPFSRFKYAFRRIRAKLIPHQDSGPHCCKPLPQQ